MTVADYIPPPEIHQLVTRAWDSWRAVTPETFLVKPSIPILWFGDLDAYRRSSRRIVTVGLNPSRVEFPKADPFRRFPRARTAAVGEVALVVEAQNEYFRCDPYRRWFQAFEPLLNGMGGSFYDGRGKRAIHTDLCSPLATDPTWTGLTSRQRSLLLDKGAALWHDLIRAVRPHVALISVAEQHLDNLAFPLVNEWRTAYRVERTNPYIIRTGTLQIDSVHRIICVFGRAAQMPFGLISDEEKRRAGRAVLEVLDV